LWDCLQFGDADELITFWGQKFMVTAGPNALFW